MTYKDLRYDNLVKGHLTGRYLRVDWLVMKHMEDGNIQSVYTPNIPVYEPIPLTPEILVKAGFEKYQWMDGYFLKTKFGDLMIQFFKSEIYLFFTNVGADTQGMKFKGKKYVGNLNSTQNIKHVHQLQNLYFALTGEELIFEL